MIVTLKSDGGNPIMYLQAGNPSSDELRGWWLQVSIASFQVRSLYDSRAARTAIGSVGIQIATATPSTRAYAYHQIPIKEKDMHHSIHGA